MIWYIEHYGVGHLKGGHSGRYQWGSGARPYQSEDQKKKTHKEITEAYNSRNFIKKKKTQGIQEYLNKRNDSKYNVYKEAFKKTTKLKKELEAEWLKEGNGSDPSISFEEWVNRNNKNKKVKEYLKVDKKENRILKEYIDDLVGDLKNETLDLASVDFRIKEALLLEGIEELNQNSYRKNEEQQREDVDKYNKIQAKKNTK